jgi:cellulose synthase/poly-beta-1,6-N-acetylglucosamine synthase-like glycosyltransferase
MTWQQVLYGVYLFGLVIITLYSLFQAHLLIHYYRWVRKRDRLVAPPFSEGAPDLPYVTVQIALYNERMVAAQIIDAVARFEWPLDRLEIQVLDDSTDETVRIVDDKVDDWCAKGIDIKALRRRERTGFKAGALSAGTEAAKGDYIAIFDADFLPSPDFLRRMMPYFDDPGVGIVQGRWGHLNLRHSFITHMQGILLDGFYHVEQPGRAFADYLIRFNGSGGVLRKACIEDSGGWSGDTLAEDLDLCYRAQLGGWKIHYAHDVVAEAELPLSLDDFKEQQFRWTKGKAQVLRKLGGRLFRARISRTVKAHAYADVCNIFVYLSAFVCTVLSVPLAWIVYGTGTFPDYIIDASFGLISLFIWMQYVVVVLGYQMEGKIRRAWAFAWLFPATLMTLLGIMFYQTLALVQGFFGGSGEFLRTPKRGSQGVASGYRSSHPLGVTAIEALLTLYFGAALWMDFNIGAIAFVPLHVALASGYAFVVGHSLAARVGVRVGASRTEEKPSPLQAA